MFGQFQRIIDRFIGVLTGSPGAGRLADPAGYGAACPLRDMLDTKNMGAEALTAVNSSSGIVAAQVRRRSFSAAGRC